jgi:hypothetical protein
MSLEIKAELTSGADRKSDVMRPGKLYEEREKCPRPIRINSILLSQDYFSFQLIRPLDFLRQLLSRFSIINFQQPIANGLAP